LEGSNSSASLGIPKNQQNESTVSENVNDEPGASQDQEYESSLLQFDQSTATEQHDVVEQLNPSVEMLQFSENVAVDNKSIEDVRSFPVSTKKYDDVLALIGEVSIDHSASQDMGAWPI
jgi:hypothetical protein